MENFNIKSVNIKEWYVGFYEVCNQTAANFKTDSKNIGKNNIDLRKCSGQGYDGAANMCDKCWNMQAKIKKIML